MRLLVFLVGVQISAALSIIASSANAQWFAQAASPRSMALAESTIANATDALSQNPALAFDSATRISTAFIPLPIGLDNSWTAFGNCEFAMNSGQRLGASVYRSSYADIYSDEEFGALYAKTFAISDSAHATAGVQLRFSDESFGVHYLPLQDLSLDMGATFDVAANFTLGAAVTHLVSLYQNQGIASDTRTTWFGVHYRPIRELSLLGAVEYQQVNGARIHAGAEYFLDRYLTLRVGVIPSTSEFCGGIGVTSGRFQLDVAFTHHPDLGSTICFGIGYEL
jgi:hypothetical protein